MGPRTFQHFFQQPVCRRFPSKPAQCNLRQLRMLRHAPRRSGAIATHSSHYQKWLLALDYQAPAAFDAQSELCDPAQAGCPLQAACLTASLSCVLVAIKVAGVKSRSCNWLAKSPRTWFNYAPTLYRRALAHPARPQRITWVRIRRTCKTRQRRRPLPFTISPYQGQIAMSASENSLPATYSVTARRWFSTSSWRGFHRIAVNRVLDLDRRIGKNAQTPPTNGALPICQNSHDRHSARAAAILGQKAPNFSARYIRMAPDSNTRTGLAGRCGLAAPEFWSWD